MKIANLVFNSFTNDSRVLKESISLANEGYDVEVIAHRDRGLNELEIEKNFNIRRFSYLNREESRNIVSKLGAYLNYLRLSAKHCKTFDIIHCNDLDTLPIAFIVKKFYNKNIKVVYDAHEYETERHHQSELDKKILKILERFLLKYVDKMITVSEPIADEYAKLYNIELPTVIYNTPKEIEIEKKDIFREKFNISKDKIVFLYQGSLSRGRNIEIILEIFKHREDKAVVVFMGYGGLEDLIVEHSHKYKNIYFHKAVSPDILLDYTSSADFGISMIEDSCLSYHYCLPNKMFEYLMAEVPVIVSNLPEMKKVVEEYSVGVVAKENTIEGLKDAIEEAISLDMNKINKNIKKIKKIYNWEEQEKKLFALYKEVTS